MKPQRAAINWSELLRNGMAALFLIFAIVARIQNAHDAALALFGLTCVLGFLAWLSSLRLYRTIHDTPVSGIASAAQGQVKLAGKVSAFPGRMLKSPLSGTECVWYRCLVPGGKKYGIESGDSDAPFVLTDGEGQCVIEPAGAEIFTHHRTEWREPDKGLLRSKSEQFKPENGVAHSLMLVDPAQPSGADRSEYFDEFLLLPGDSLLAMGYFISGQISSGEPRVKADISRRLAEWKEDSQTLQARFDLNGDQKVNEQEWQLARSAARREVLGEHGATLTDGQQHRLVNPPDGRPFVLSTVPTRWLALRYLFVALFNLAVFFIGLWGVSSGMQ
jgi:hypothetical protein